MQNALLAAAAADSWAGNPVILILGIVCLAGGVWYSIHLRKTKSKEELKRERRRLSNQFLDRIVDDANRSAGFDVEEKPKKKRAESADPITMAAEKLVEEKDKKRRKK